MRIQNLMTDRSSRLPGDYAPQGFQEQESPQDAPANLERVGTATWRGSTLVIILFGPPIGKPRMTQRDKWAKRPAVMRYRAWADRLREVAGVVPPASEVVDLSWTAYFVPPKSWPKKRRDEAIGTQHRSKPDRDNIDKAVLDVLYPGRDQAIASGTLAKRWSRTARIEIEIEVT